MGIDELDFDDDLDYGQQEPGQQQQEPNEEEEVTVIEDTVEDTIENEGDDVLTAFLKSKGIKDINNIKFEEDGKVVNKSWDDLTAEEQFNIMHTENRNPDEDLDDEEIDLVNRIRLSQVSPREFINQIRNQAVQQYVQEQQNAAVPQYTVDDLSDEELYVFDLQTRLGEGEYTEEELDEALAQAKQNPDLFAKQIRGIREDYKRLEDEANAKNKQAEQEENQKRYQEFSNQIVNSISNFQNIGELDVAMDDDDMNELARYILETDSTGTSYFGRALNEPETLVKLAWFALKGEEVMNSISDYYKNQIASVSRERYNAGLAAGQAQTNSKPMVAIRKGGTKSTSNYRPGTYKTIDDLD